MAVRAQLRMQKWRFALGMLQIAGVGLSMGIISRQGLSALAMLFVIATTLIAVVSNIIFRRDNGGPSA
jgi:hypothetical protein